MGWGSWKHNVALLSPPLTVCACKCRHRLREESCWNARTESKQFSLHPCRSSSVLSYFLQRDFEGDLAGICRLSFGLTKNDGQIKKKKAGNVGAFFVDFVWGCAKGAEKASCGETVVQKGVLESPFLLFSHLRFSGVFRANLTGQEKKRTLQKHPFGRPFPRTTPSPLLWRALIVNQNASFVPTSLCRFNIPRIYF